MNNRPSPSTTWLLALGALGIAALVFQLGPYFELVERIGSPGLIDEAPARDLQGARDRLAQMDEATLELYRSHLAWDALVAVANGVLLASLLLLASRPWPNLQRWCPALPSLLVLADWLENFGIALWIEVGLTEARVALVAGATSTKFLCLGLCGVTLSVTCLARLARWRPRRKASPSPVEQL